MTTPTARRLHHDPPPTHLLKETFEGDNLRVALSRAHERGDDRTAFELLWRLESRPWLAWLVQRGLPPEAADDVLQATFAKAWRTRAEHSVANPAARIWTMLRAEARVLMAARN